MPAVFFFQIHFNQPVWNYQHPTCSAAPCAAANKSLPSSEGGEAACQPTNNVTKRPPFQKKKQIAMVSLMRTYMFGRCLVYCSEKKTHVEVETNILINQGLQSPELYESVCVFTKKSYDILNSAWCHGQPPPPSLVGLLGIYLLGLGFCCSFGKFRSKDFMQS